MTRLTVAIPSYGREQVLIDSIAALFALTADDWELLLVDQTLVHEPSVEVQLHAWQDQGMLRWIRQSTPSITMAMNRALLEARGEHVLFLDDDIRPDPGLLLAHQAAFSSYPGALIAGRVLQPWHGDLPDSEGVPFAFNSLDPRGVLDFIGCNFSLPRLQAIELGGFDQQFVRVAYRYEAEFAHRWRRAGYPIRYEPAALINHLRAERGGTRSYGRHLATTQPSHSVGRYYFLLRTKVLPLALATSAAALARSVRSRHHLRQPWWIPLTLLAELRGFFWALSLWMRGPHLIRQRFRLLIVTTHPIQYQVPLFRRLAKEPGLDLEVLYLCQLDDQQQGVGFGQSFQWDIPLLDGYRWRLATGVNRKANPSRFQGLWLVNPFSQLVMGATPSRPDAVFICGWQCLAMLQLFAASHLLNLPILMRGDSNDLSAKSFLTRVLHRFIAKHADFFLAVGASNTRFYRASGCADQKILLAPHFVDNEFFLNRAISLQPDRPVLRKSWDIPFDSYCFLFVGKLESKKKPLQFIQAIVQLLQTSSLPLPVHGLVVGSGELEQQCKTLVHELSAPVSFTGFLNQSQISAAYAVADALVLPSDSGETWGLVVNEAMASGLPAIVSDQVGCAFDLVQPGLTGEIFPCDDIAALASAMGRLALAPELSREMGRRAQQRVIADFNVEASVTAVRTAARRLDYSV